MERWDGNDEKEMKGENVEKEMENEDNEKGTGRVA